MIRFNPWTQLDILTLIISPEMLARAALIKTYSTNIHIKGYEVKICTEEE